MPYAHAVKKVTMSGTSFGGAEIWSTGFYVGSVGADVSNPTQQFADDIRTAWTVFWQHLDTDINSGWKTNTIKVAQIAANGETNEANVVYAPYGTPIAGSNNGLIYPPQIAMVATLERAGARGLAAKGRMYLPGVSKNITTNGQISTSDTLELAVRVKTFLDAVNAAAPVGESVILASQGNRVKNAEGVYVPVPGTAVNAEVDRVRVGSVYDTQRRRRNALVELYQSSTLA